MPGAAGQAGRYDVGGGHVTVSTLMMFIHADALEPELVGQLQLIQVPVVQRMTELGIVK
jgi:hypothetical protein